MARADNNLAGFVTFLGHDIFAIKSIKTGEPGAQEDYFRAITINKAIDHISLRNGQRQLWITLQRLKAIPVKEDGSKKYHDFTDITHYANILLDIDAIKPDGMKDYAATEEERAKALDQIPETEDWLKSHDFNPGLKISTGNGAAFILPIPPIPSEPFFIAKASKFLQLVKKETGCNIDEAMYDPPRVVGIIGTINAKLEAEGRTNRTREAIGGIPDRREDQKLLDFIQGLEPDAAVLAEYQQKFGQSKDHAKETKTDDVIERLSAIFEKDPAFKAKFYYPAPKGQRSTTECHLCACLFEHGFNEDEIYHIMNYSPQTKWLERGDDYRRSTVKAGIEKGQACPDLINAIKALSKVCDGAHSKDKTGFNKKDAPFFASISEAVDKGENIPLNQAKNAYRRLEKYYGQLRGFGIDYYKIKAPKEEAKTSASTGLVSLALEGTELWHSPEGWAYITITRNGHKEHHSLKTKAVKLWLSSLAYRLDGRTPGGQALQDALNVLEGLARFDGPEYPVFVRVAPYEDKVYVDLGRPEWNYIEISREGWRVVQEAPVRFKRSKTLGPMPIPQKGGKWEDLRKVTNAKDEYTWRSIVGWLMQGFWPHGPYTHLNFRGEQGSAKSSNQKICKKIVDPSITPLRRPPRDERDLMIAANNERVPSFDNLSGMPEHLSDAFCCLATGASLGSRELYTDDEEIVLSAKRPCAFNGIDFFSYRGDLIDRTIDAELLRIEEKDRKTEKEMDAAFEAIWPYTIGLILDATVMGLKRENEIQVPRLPRMADFAKWVMACEPALPWEEGGFLEAYQKQAKDSISTAFEADPVARAIFDLATRYAQIGKSFEGTATELLFELNILRGIDPNRPPKGWPKTGSVLGSRITRAAPGLRHRNVRIEKDRSGEERKLTIRLMTAKGDGHDGPTEKAVTEKTASENPNDGHDGDDGEIHGYSVDLTRKEEEKREEEECEVIRIVGKNAVMAVTPSQNDQEMAIPGVTAQGAMTAKVVIPEACAVGQHKTSDSTLQSAMGKTLRETPKRKGSKAQRSPEMAKFKNILSGLVEPFTLYQLYAQCDTAGLPPSKYKAWIQEEEQCGRMIRSNGHYEMIKEARTNQLDAETRQGQERLVAKEVHDAQMAEKYGAKPEHDLVAVHFIQGEPEFVGIDGRNHTARLYPKMLQRCRGFMPRAL